MSEVLLHVPYINNSGAVIKLEKTIVGPSGELYYETEEGFKMDKQAILENYSPLSASMIDANNNTSGMNPILASLSGIDGLELDEMRLKTPESFENVRQEMPVMQLEKQTNIPSTTKNILDGFKTNKQKIIVELELDLPKKDFINMFIENMEDGEEVMENLTEYYLHLNIEKIKTTVKNTIDKHYEIYKTSSDTEDEIIIGDGTITENGIINVEWNPVNMEDYDGDILDINVMDDENG